MTTETEDKQALEARREKYRQERDKRLQAERQYAAIEGDLARFAEDPRAEKIERAPIDEDCDLLIVGAGHSALLAGARAREAGYTGRIRFLDTASDFGGTWYWNQYPGAQSDTEAYIYMPLLEETGYIPSERYAHAPEIWEHTRRIARHYNFYDGAVFQTAVQTMTWDEDLARWRVKTDRGDEFRSRYVILATGIGLQVPHLPAIPGINDFKGKAFHSARWDYEYTGGDSNGNLHKLKDKKVAVIGTGATAVQLVPHVGEWAQHLYVFQRTPSSIDVRNNRPTEQEFVESLEPGWQQRRMENFSHLTGGLAPGLSPTAVFRIFGEDGSAPEDMIRDGWSDIPRRVLEMDRSGLSPDDLAEVVERLDYEKMQQIRDRVDTIVQDRNAADALKPYYRLWCKRPCFHDEYLPTYNRPNVTLVDTQGKGVERITERGVVANGQEYEVDLIVFASGFDPLGGAFDITGRNGVKLTEKFATGISTLYGVQTSGFPNLFMMRPVHVGISLNVTHILWVLARHIGRVFKRAMDHGWQTVDVAPSAEEDWTNTIESTSLWDADYVASCTPGAYNSEGQINPESEELIRARKRSGFYGPGILAFTQLLDEWYESGKFEGLEFTDSPDRAREPAATS